MEEWKFGPPVLIGERVAWVKNSEKPTENGVVRWIGKLSKESDDWTVGVELDNSLPCGGTDGSWGDRKLFDCDSKRGVFLPLSRIRKEMTKIKEAGQGAVQKEIMSSEKSDCKRKSVGLISVLVDKDDRRCDDQAADTIRTPPNLRLNNAKFSVREHEEGNGSSDTDDLKSDFQSLRKSLRRRRKRNKSPRAITRREDHFARPFSITGRLGDNGLQSRDKTNRKKHESCALEEKYIREFIQREIGKQQERERLRLTEMNDVKGNFKKIEEDDIHNFDRNAFGSKPPEGRTSTRTNHVFHRRDKNPFFSFLKWFKKSKEMPPELEAIKDSSVTSSPLFVRRRSSSCGSVDTLFSIATANSFAFVSPVQYQAVISSSHTTYPVSMEKLEPQATPTDDSKRKSDYENCPAKPEPSPTESATERRKKCRAPAPPARDISLPSTLEHKKPDEDDKAGHRRTVSESFKDKKAGYYCHVHGKRKAPLPPSAGNLYPTLSSLKSQCPSIGKKKRPAPPPPEPSLKSKDDDPSKVNPSSYDNLPFRTKQFEPTPSASTPKPIGINLSPLLGLDNDITSSPLPSRPWFKRSSGAGNIHKKESTKFSDKKRNKENEEWMPEVGFSRRPISNEGSGHNIFNLLSRLDRSQDKKKDEKRKSQISILANISELDREAAEIVRKEIQERKMMADNDEKYYTTQNESNNVLLGFPSISEKVPEKTVQNSFEEFKRRGPVSEQPDTTEKPVHDDASAGQMGVKDVVSDANAELDYYINPWNCPECTLENPGWQKFCDACFTVRVKFQSQTREKVKPENIVVNISRRPGNVVGAKTEKKDEDLRTEMKLEKREEMGPKSNVQTDEAVDANLERKSEEKAESKVKTRTVILAKSKSEDFTASTKDQEDPTEDNVEGLRRKRLAFFTNKQNSLRAEPSPSISPNADEVSKLRMMVKEMKNSLPQRETTVKNNNSETGTEKDATDRGECSKHQHSDHKVQQTQSGAVGKVDQARTNVAEAIVVTQTTIHEDIFVKKTPKVSASVQTNTTSVKEFNGNVAMKKDVDLDSYANLQEVKGLVDLSGHDNERTGDIEAITAELRDEGTTSKDYKVNIRATSSTDGGNTLDVNRLLRRLEAAINNGQHLEAANIAKELATMKVRCSVKREKVVPEVSSSKIVVDLYIEDKLTHKGPIQIQIMPSITLGQLKMKVEREWNIPRDVQRWILGKQLATDESKTLEQHGVTGKSCPLFLYLITSEKSGDGLNTATSAPDADRKNGKVTYMEARRPSLIIEEDGESQCEDEEEIKVEKPKSRETRRLSTPGAKRREMLQRKDSETSFSFEKREMNEALKKELKVISANSVKDRIEMLYRAATGESALKPNDVRNSDVKSKQSDNSNEAREQKVHYNELMQLENTDLVTNVEGFECPICMVEYGPREGVVLKDCLHVFCRPCLVNTIQFNDEAEVKCPYRDDNYSCESVLQQREIKSLVPKGIFEQHLAKSVSVAENNIGNAYHCKTPDCKGWCILEDNVNEFRCPVCRRTNCLTCQAIHTGLNCRQYQEQLQFASDTNVEAKKTRDMLQEMVEKGEAMACPTCAVVLMKKWGCDWLRCSMCKTEICWVTRGPRWGPGGKGDTSGGCQCGLNGVKCHPKCNYCH